MSKKEFPILEQQPLSTTPQIPAWDYTPEEITILPNSFEPDIWQKYYIFFNNTVYAERPNSTKWHFEKNNEPITKYSRDCHYPNFLNIEIESVFESIQGIYQEKKVTWMDNTKCWQYLNHKIVDFSTIKDKEQVTAILELTVQTLSSIQLSKSPMLPGTLPETPAKATSEQKPGTIPVATHVPAQTLSKEKASVTIQAQPPSPLKQAMASSSGTPVTVSNQKLLRTLPYPFNGAADQTEAFWSDLTNYYYLNQDIY